MVDEPTRRICGAQDERDAPATGWRDEAGPGSPTEQVPTPLVVRPTVDDGACRTQLRAAIGPALVAVGGLAALVSFLLLPALDPQWGAPLPGRRFAATVGVLWVVPVAAVLLVALGVLALLERRLPPAVARLRVRGDVAATALAAAAAVGLVALLVVLDRPAVVARLYLRGLDPYATAGSGYWLMLLGAAGALVGASWELLRGRTGASRGRLVVAGTGLGVVVGTLAASFLLDARLQDTQSVVVLGVAAEDTGPDFAVAQPVVRATPEATTTVLGDAERLYGGTFRTSPCRRDELAAFLTGSSWTRRDAWRFAVGGTPSEPAEYVATLTPLVLRLDTRVTAHRFDGDHVVPYQSILPAGTAVLVDRRGVPRVRCAGAAPLTVPRTVAGTPRFVGAGWAELYPASAVTVQAAAGEIAHFGLLEQPGLFRRPAGSTGDRDVAEVPSEGLPDGEYDLGARQVSCNLNDCEVSAQLSASFSVRGCPQQCRVTSSLWTGDVELRRSGGRYTAVGTAEAGYECRDDPQPTTASVELQVTGAAVVDQVWTATALQGTVRKSSPRTETCSAGGEVFEASMSR